MNVQWIDIHVVTGKIVIDTFYQWHIKWLVLYLITPAQMHSSPIIDSGFKRFTIGAAEPVDIYFFNYPQYFCSELHFLLVTHSEELTLTTGGMRWCDEVSGAVSFLLTCNVGFDPHNRKGIFAVEQRAHIHWKCICSQWGTILPLGTILETQAHLQIPTY